MKFKLNINESLNATIRKKLSKFSDSQLKTALVDLYNKKDKSREENATYTMTFSELEQRFIDAGKIDEFDKWCDIWYK